MGNPTRIDWFPGPDLPSPGVRLVGVYFPTNGKFYVMGGRSMDGAGHDFVHPFEYDPVSNTWATKSASYPDNQVSDMACGVLNDSGTDYIYCVGGSAGGQTTATERVFRYDPVTDTITTIASPWPGDTDGITLPGGFSVSNNNLYILGGFRINTAMTDQIWRFTPGTNVWVVQGTMLPVPRGYIPTTTIRSSIYTCGGSLWDGTMLQDTTDSFSYDPVSDTIVQIASIPSATAETQALTIGGFMWVFGGGETPPNPSNQVDFYDPVKNSWLTAQPFITARRNFATGIGGAGCVWLVGGYASDGTPLSSMETTCPAGPTPTPTATVTPTPTPTQPPPSPTATATVTVSGTPTASPSATCSCKPRSTPTSRPRPTPPPRP
jgi:Kelch motif/Galactose oxidase, central domain